MSSQFEADSPSVSRILFIYSGRVTEKGSCIAHLNLHAAHGDEITGQDCSITKFEGVVGRGPTFIADATSGDVVGANRQGDGRCRKRRLGPQFTGTQ